VRKKEGKQEKGKGKRGDGETPCLFTNDNIYDVTDFCRLYAQYLN